MKKLILATFGLAFAANVAVAEKIIPTNDKMQNSELNIISKEFTYSKTPMFCLMSYDNDYDEPSDYEFWIYDENIDLVKTIKASPRDFHYSQSYNVQKRDEIVEKQENKQIYRDFNSIADWIADCNKYNPNFERSLVIKTLANGDKIVSQDYSVSQGGDGYNGFGRFYRNEDAYFGYREVGFKYPRVYYLFTGDEIYQCSAEYICTGYSDWTTVGSEVEEKTLSLNCVEFSDANMDNGNSWHDGGGWLVVTQTLFNNDEDYEYIVPKLGLSATNHGADENTGTVYPADGLLMERRVPAEGLNFPVVTGFQVVSSNGNIVKDLNFENGFEASVKISGYGRPYIDNCTIVTIGGNRYLVFDGYVNGDECSVFYKIDSASGAVSQMKVLPTSMKIRPSVVDRSNTINVTFGDNNANGSDIVVTSMSGSTVGSVSVPQNQNHVEIPANLPSGVYCVSRIEQGKVNETQKIIVK